jgi:hypothetical protein
LNLEPLHGAGSQRRTGKKIFIMEKKAVNILLMAPNFQSVTIQAKTNGLAKGKTPSLLRRI